MEKDVKLLYLLGFRKLDNLLERKYPGEDLYVLVNFFDDRLIMTIRKSKIVLMLQDITDIQLIYDDGQIMIRYKNSECLFSYEHLITYELLSILYTLGYWDHVPEFLKNRYQEMQDRHLFSMIDLERELISPNAFIHYYDDIDDRQYAYINNSMKLNALKEVPLIYIKYLLYDRNEFGLLVTNSAIYSPENSIAIKDIQDIYLQEIEDYIQFIINGDQFSKIHVILFEKMSFQMDFIGFPIPIGIEVKDNFFPTEQIGNLIGKICNHLNNRDIQTRIK